MSSRKQNATPAVLVRVAFLAGVICACAGRTSTRGGVSVPDRRQKGPCPNGKTWVADQVGDSLAALTVLETDAGVDPPELLSRAFLTYPQAARQAGWEASVVVTALVDTTGRPTHVHICKVDVFRRSSPPPEPRGQDGIPSFQIGSQGEMRYAFESEIRRFVPRLVFRPAQRAGRPLMTLVQLPFNFRLRR